MKKKLLFISGLLLVTTVLFAQAPMFTSSYHPNPGSSVDEQFVSASGISLGDTGASQTWNYTSLSAADSGSPVTGGYVAASSTPSYWASIYPSANLAEGSNAIGYLYTETTSSNWLILGFAGTSSGDTLRYTTPETIFTYPFSYPNIFASTFAANSSVTANGVTETDTRTGTDTFNADGYGTLDLPGGSNYIFTNVLRAVLIQNYRDVFDEEGLYDTLYERVYTVDYFWASNPNQPLLSISTLTETEDGFVIGSGTSADYYPNTATAINDVNPLVKNLNVFPNPSNSQSTLALSLKDGANINVYVTNIIGQRVKTIATEQTDAGDHTYTIETGDMAKGLYFVTVEANNVIAGVRKLEIE